VKEEARILENLNHPNVVLFKKVCETETRILIAMELVKGGSLADLIKSKKAAKEILSEKEISTIVKSMFQGLAYIHGKNIVHRDIKPGDFYTINTKYSARI
jgi:serine/threonine protein kinase